MKKRLFTAERALLLATNQPFTASATKQFAEAVNGLAARNIIEGYPEGKFKPSNSIMRVQAAKMLKTTEKAKPVNTTMESSDLGWDKYSP